MKIAVVGAGPAGLLCAWQLAEAGHSMMIYEQRKALGAKGSGVLLQPIGLSALEHLGIREHVESYGQRVDAIRGYVGFNRKRKVIDASYGLLKRKINYALGINRSTLWTILFQKVTDLNIVIKTNASIESLSYQTAGHDKEQRSIEVIGEKQQSFGCYDLVIDASGAHSKLRGYSLAPGNGSLLDYGSLWAKVKLHKDSQFNTHEMTVFTGLENHGLGLMPTGKSELGDERTMTLFFNFKYQNNQSPNLSNFDEWRTAALTRCPNAKELIEQLKSPAQLYPARFMHYTMAKPYGTNIVFVGDAAHCSSPQLGQGINMSLIDALVLCDVLKNSSDVEVALKRYAKARKKHVRIYQTMAKLLTPFYQSDDALAIFARDHYFRILFKLQLFKRITAAILSGTVGRPLRLLRTGRSA